MTMADEGLMTLAATVEKAEVLPTLEWVYLQNNPRVTAVGGAALARALAGGALPALTYIYLDEGVNADETWARVAASRPDLLVL